MELLLFSKFGISWNFIHFNIVSKDTGFG
jgi:hypothetical protein